ncbi:hypothetical protein ACEPPN_015245 [Leptodophora sp. 'Broadleaf-Isolate-01']
MTTCRLSREIAQIRYHLLLSDSTQPVYFDPEVDFLYCKLALDYSVRNRHDVEPVLSFVNTSPLATKIRYLVLDMSYWSEQVTRMSQRPNFAAMPELHLLTGIEELFLVVPSLEDELANKRRIYGNFSDGENGGLTKEKLERVSAALVESDRQSPNSIVPGARVYCGRTPSCDKEWALARAFGMTTLHFWGSGWRTAVDGVWQRHGRKEPGLTEIRPLSK